MSSDFDENVQEAAVRVFEMDRIDGMRDRSLPTILAALQAGLQNPSTGAQFDALVMLSEIVKEQRF